MMMEFKVLKQCVASIQAFQTPKRGKGESFALNDINAIVVRLNDKDRVEKVVDHRLMDCKKGVVGMAPQVLDPATYRVMVFTLSGSVEGPHPRSGTIRLTASEAVLTRTVKTGMSSLRTGLHFALDHAIQGKGSNQNTNLHCHEVMSKVYMIEIYNQHGRYVLCINKSHAPVRVRYDFSHTNNHRGRCVATRPGDGRLSDTVLPKSRMVLLCANNSQNPNGWQATHQLRLTTAAGNAAAHEPAVPDNSIHVPLPVQK